MVPAIPLNTAYAPCNAMMMMHVGDDDDDDEDDGDADDDDATAADVAVFDECLVSECLSRLNATLVYCPYWCPSGLVEM